MNHATPTKALKPKKKAASKPRNKKMETTTTPSTSFKLVDNCPRSPLSEGRDYGISFAFCKRDGNTFATVGPLSPCKDYLNDQVYSELTGKPFSAWGYKAKKEGLLENTDLAYVALAILPFKNGGKYDSQKDETDYLDKHHECVASFLNYFEERLPFPQRTVIVKVGENRYVALIPKFWAEACHRISLWALLVRVAVESFYKEGNPHEALKNCKTGDGCNVMLILPKLEAMLAGTIPPAEDFTQYKNWHNEGICSFAFPFTPPDERAAQAIIDRGGKALRDAIENGQALEDDA